MPEAGIQVVVRLRPMNERELQRNTLPVVSASTDNREVTVIRNNASQTLRNTFKYDNVFTAFSDQQDVFDATLRPVIDDVLSGYESTVLAYGQTGTGKTYTMEGNLESDKEWGVIPRSANDIFKRLSDKSYIESHVSASYLEIYNEELADLLLDESVGAAPKLSVVEDRGDEKRRGRGVMVTGLSDEVVASTEDVLNLMARAQQRRKTGETKMNKSSSRSHCLFTLCVQAKLRLEDGNVLDTTGKLHMVDLAGSECAKSAGGGEKEQAGRERERKNINQSLLTLGRVISLLKSNQNNPGKHQERIPYRDSKLTRLLSESLGGRSKTIIIATVSPSVLAVDETTSTLQYAQSAQGIQNKPIAQSYLKMNAEGRPGTAGAAGGAGINIEQWQEMEARLAYLEAQADEATAALARKHKEQEVIIQRAKEAEAERDALLVRVDEFRAMMGKASSCATEAQAALQTVTTSASELSAELRSRRDDLVALVQDKVSRPTTKFAELAGSSAAASERSCKEGAAADAAALARFADEQETALGVHQMLLSEEAQALEEASKAAVARVSAVLQEATTALHASEESLQRWCEGIVEELGAKGASWNEQANAIGSRAAAFAEEMSTDLLRDVHHRLDVDGKQLVDRMLDSEVEPQRLAIDEASATTVARRDASARFFDDAGAATDSMSGQVRESVREHRCERRDAASLELLDEKIVPAGAKEASGAASALESIGAHVGDEAERVSGIGGAIARHNQALHEALERETAAYEKLHAELGAAGAATDESLKTRAEKDMFEQATLELADGRKESDASADALVALLRSHLAHLKELRADYFAKQREDHEQCVKQLKGHMQSLEAQHSAELARHERHAESLRKQLAALQRGHAWISGDGKDALVKRVLDSINETVTREVASFARQVVDDHVTPLEDETANTLLPWSEEARRVATSDYDAQAKECAAMESGLAALDADLRAGEAYVKDVCEEEDVGQKLLPSVDEAQKLARARADMYGATSQAWHSADEEHAASLRAALAELRRADAASFAFFTDTTRPTYEAAFVAVEQLSEGTARVRESLANSLKAKVTSCAEERAAASAASAALHAELGGELRCWKAASLAVEAALEDGIANALSSLRAQVDAAATETAAQDAKLSGVLSDVIMARNAALSAGLRGEVHPLLATCASASKDAAVKVGAFGEAQRGEASGFGAAALAQTSAWSTGVQGAVLGEERRVVFRDTVPAQCGAVRETVAAEAARLGEANGRVATSLSEQVTAVRRAFEAASSDLGTRASAAQAAAETTAATVGEGASSLTAMIAEAMAGVESHVSAEELAVAAHVSDGVSAPISGTAEPQLSEILALTERALGHESENDENDENAAPLSATGGKRAAAAVGPAGAPYPSV